MKLKELTNKFINRYLIIAMSGMALGLFSTLIVGLIIKQIAGFVGDNIIGITLMQFGSIASAATGVGIAIGTANALNSSKLVLYSTSVVGLIGAYSSKILDGSMIGKSSITLMGPGEPLGAFIAAVVAVEIGRLVAGKTKLDIILTPIVTIVSGGLTGLLVGPPISNFMSFLGKIIVISTEQQPLIMGILVSVIMGIILTLPISSAALSIILGLSGLAAGAATVGCSSHMIGFAVASYKENKINGLIAQGLGTSMLQMPNIIKNPKIFLPPIITSAILGPVATMVFNMKNNPAGAGMGTSGLVGQFMTWSTMSGTENNVILLIKILVLHFLLPAIITLVIAEFMRKKGMIKDGDMKLDV